MEAVRSNTYRHRRATPRVSLGIVVGIAGTVLAINAANTALNFQMFRSLQATMDSMRKELGVKMEHARTEVKEDMVKQDDRIVTRIKSLLMGEKRV